MSVSWYFPVSLLSLYQELLFILCIFATGCKGFTFVAFLNSNVKLQYLTELRIGGLTSLCMDICNFSL